jgi:hypothetical protein
MQYQSTYAVQRGKSTLAFSCITAGGTVYYALLTPGTKHAVRWYPCNVYGSYLVAVTATGATLPSVARAWLKSGTAAMLGL